MKKISLLFLIFFWHIHAQETSFEWEDKPFKVLNLEEGYLGNLSVTQEELDIVIDTTKMGLLAAETVFRGN